jgi:hypothetical protein
MAYVRAALATLYNPYLGVWTGERDAHHCLALSVLKPTWNIWPEDEVTSSRRPYPYSRRSDRNTQRPMTISIETLAGRTRPGRLGRGFRATLVAALRYVSSIESAQLKWL